MLTYSFSNKGELSLYEYLYRCIRADIEAGALAPGEKRVGPAGVALTQAGNLRHQRTLLAKIASMVKRCSLISQVRRFPWACSPMRHGQNR